MTDREYIDSSLGFLFVIFSLLLIVAIVAVGFELQTLRDQIDGLRQVVSGATAKMGPQ